MPFLLFFEPHLDCLINRAEAVYPDAAKEFAEFKQKLSETVRETDKHRLIEEITDKYQLSLWVKDKNSVFNFANKACADLILRTSAPIFKRNGAFCEDALSLFCVEGDKKVIARNETIRFIEHAVYVDGVSVWIDICKSPLRNTRQEIYGTIGSAVNIVSIVPDNIQEQYQNAQSIEIDADVILTAEKITEIIEKESEV